MGRKMEVSKDQEVVMSATFVAEELERTLGLVKKGYFSECRTSGLLVDLLEVISSNARTAESRIKDITGADYPWEYECEDGSRVSTDQVSTNWVFTLIGRRGE